ncbi:MAG TPA: hypothetical protein VFB27_01195 [Opitutaceae bacterium]|nr:hypothetical protein [Opitutaceae bacterium]
MSLLTGQVVLQSGQYVTGDPQIRISFACGWEHDPRSAAESSAPD